MSDKSTPTPWKVTERHYVDAPIGDGRLQEVAYCGDCEVGSRNANARLIVTAVNYHHRLREALLSTVEKLERSTCLHEETYRGGAIWEICSHCGMKWADDEGGKPESSELPEVEQARTILTELNNLESSYE